MFERSHLLIARLHTARAGSLAVIAAGLFGMTVLLAGAPATPADQIDRIVTEESNTAIWGVYMLDLRTNGVLYEYNPNTALLPASTQKLITTAVALETLGADFRYRTALYFVGSVRGAVLQGDLILKGSGDPTFGSIQVGGADPLREWARSLASMGVTRIEGRIIGDDDVFDDQPFAEGWDIDYLTSQASRLIGVSASGLSYHDNVIEVSIQAAGAGEAPTVTSYPEGYLQVRNEAITSTRRRGIAVNLNRDFVNEAVVLQGSVPRTYRATVAVPVINPTAYTVHSLAHLLKEAGIEVAAEPLDIDRLDEKPDLKGAEPLFVHLSPPLSEIIAILNKESNNFYAEQVFRTFAPGGSAAGGELRVKQVLAAAGINTQGFSMRDGSGLSRKNIVTPEMMSRLLAYMYRRDTREAFLGSLARGGEYRTTLSGRLGGAPIHAKTGSLEFVRSLAGYAVLPDGRPVAFAILANNYTVPSHHVTHAIDRIVMSLAGSENG